MKLSGIMVLRNGNGWFLGKKWFDKSINRWVNHERHSPYFSTIDEVNEALAETKTRRNTK